MTDTTNTAATVTDQDTTAAADTDTTTAAETAQTQTDVDYKAEAEKWKALSRQNEAQAKANAEKAKRLDDIEEANKTELQKASERAVAAEAKAAEAELRALKASIAAKTGVPEEMLHGTDQAELDLSAQAAIAWRGTQNTAARVGGAETGGGAAKPVQYTRSQIADSEFYKANRADILLAQQQGRIS